MKPFLIRVSRFTAALCFVVFLAMVACSVIAGMMGAMAGLFVGQWYWLPLWALYCAILKEVWDSELFTSFFNLVLHPIA